MGFTIRRIEREAWLQKVQFRRVLYCVAARLFLLYLAKVKFHLFVCYRGKKTISFSFLWSARTKRGRYLSQMNRLCAAISWAHCGLYMFGNHTQLGSASQKGWWVGWFETCYHLLKVEPTQVVYSQTNIDRQIFCSLFGSKSAQFPALITWLFVLFIALEQIEMLTQGIVGRSSIWMLCD